MRSLFEYSWSGNKHEIRHVIEKLILKSQNNTINEKDLPDFILNFNNNNTNRILIPKMYFNFIKKNIPNEKMEKEEVDVKKYTWVGFKRET